MQEMRERAEAVIKVTRQSLGIQPSNRRETHNNKFQKKKDQQAESREKGPTIPKPAEKFQKYS